MLSCWLSSLSGRLCWTGSRRGHWMIKPHWDSLCHLPYSSYFGIELLWRVHLPKLDTHLHLVSFLLLKCDNNKCIVFRGWRRCHPWWSVGIRFFSHIWSFSSLWNNSCCAHCSLSICKTSEVIFEFVGGFSYVKTILHILTCCPFTQHLFAKDWIKLSAPNDAKLCKHCHCWLSNLKVSHCQATVGHVSQISTHHSISELKYGCFASLGDLCHFISLYREVTSLLLSSSAILANLFVLFLWEDASKPVI